MTSIVKIFTSSVGKKLVMSLTGIFLLSFLVVHLTGNFLLFKNDGGVAFDVYAEFMSTNPLIRTMEIVLALGFLFHIISGVIVWLQNRKARPKKYSVNKISENTKLASRITMLTGSVVFFFLVVHLKTFWVGSRLAPTKISMYELVVTAFSSPTYVGFYVVSLVFLAYHLRHGFQSAFQTLGIRVEPYGRLIEAIGIIFWLVIPVGFAIMPIYFLWYR